MRVRKNVTCPHCKTKAYVDYDDTTLDSFGTKVAKSLPGGIMKATVVAVATAMSGGLGVAAAGLVLLDKVQRYINGTTAICGNEKCGKEIQLDL